MEAAVQAAVQAWLNDPAIGEADRQEIRALQAAGDEKELVDRFYQGLEFGTGGMRGILGAGLNRMNPYTIGAAAQGLANYIGRQGEAARRAGVALAYDSRRMSRELADRVAEVLAGNGIGSYVFESPRPTPELSFAVRHLGCTAGGVVTASHNPAEWNGFKVYWSDGVQVIPPHDESIISEVKNVGGFWNVKAMDGAEARQRGLIRTIGREIDEAFLKEVDAFCFSQEVSREQGRRLRIVYTPLHGTGGSLIPEALRRRGFERVLVVPEQAEPDGEFPTTRTPNPEEGAALTLGIELARREGADLVIATDPDADRMGVAVRAGGDSFVLMTGNQIAAVLTHHLCDALARRGRFPGDGVLITTIVSGDMMKDIARAYGADVIEVLTGFKWIGALVSQFERDRRAGRPGRTYVFGAEESYGYMPATYVRDKDAVTSAACIADAAAAAAAGGRTLYDLLEDLFRRYGFYQEATRNVTLPGREGARRIRAMMDMLRSVPPPILGGLEVRTVGDLKTGQIRDRHTSRIVGRYDLPVSDVIVLTLGDGTKVIARPSGTEPKIKFYMLTRRAGDDLSRARQEAGALLAAIDEDLMQRMQ